MSAILKTTQSESRQKVHHQLGWVIVRSLVAAVLLIAAGLKAHQLATSPDFENSIFEARWFQTLLVEGEIALALILLFGIVPKISCLITIIFFTIFSVVSLVKGLNGAESCGCLGAAVQINPWVTVILDLTIVGLLAVFRPSGIVFHRQSFFQELTGLKFGKRFFAAVGVWLIVALPITYAMTSVKFSTLTPDSELTGNEKSVTLEPSQWMGKKFPLLQFLDDADVDNILTGQQNVVLFRFDCEECRQMIEKIQDKNRCIFLAIPSEKNNVALFSLPEYSMLPEKYEWWIETPIVFALENGTVKNVFKRIE